jgi:DNA-directed RNA polymerase specialized sigma24 family protein
MCRKHVPESSTSLGEVSPKKADAAEQRDMEVRPLFSSRSATLRVLVSNNRRKSDVVNSEQTVTVWIEQLRQGNESAAQRLWELYFARMVRLARKRLESARRGVADEEDVALSAFKSFCLGAQNGRFPQLMDRDSLWPLLVAITANKSVDLIRHENRQKRGGLGGVSPTSPDSEAGRGDSASRDDPRQRGDAVELSELLSNEPSPELAGEVAELFTRLMQKLEDADDPELKLIAVRRMQGESAAEIAADLGCVKRTVERKVTLIRRLWENADT